MIEPRNTSIDVCGRMSLLCYWDTIKLSPFHRTYNVILRIPDGVKKILSCIWERNLESAKKDIVSA